MKFPAFSVLFSVLILTGCNLQEMQLKNRFSGAALESSVGLEAAPAPISPEEVSRKPASGVVPGAGLSTAYSEMSDRALFEILMQRGIGECSIFDARKSCLNCFCAYYLKSSRVSWPGKGWPLNPVSKDSTGCISQYQFGGYTPDMATPDLIHNGAAQARHALADPSNPCGVDQFPASPKECPKSFLGRELEGSFMEENRLICDYSGSVNDKECRSIKGSVSIVRKGILCQKPANPSNSILMRIRRIQVRSKQ